MKELQVKIRAIPCDFEPPYSTEICQGYANGWQSALNAVVKLLEGEGWYCTRCFGGPCDPHCPEALSRKLVVAAIGDSAIRTALAALEIEARKATNDLLERQSLLNMTHEEQVSISRIARRWLVINSLILMALMLATVAVLSDCRNLRLQLQALEDQHDYLDRSVRYEETLDAIYFKPLIWSGKEEMPYGKAVDEAGKAWFPADYEEIDHKRRGR